MNRSVLWMSAHWEKGGGSHDLILESSSRPRRRRALSAIEYGPVNAAAIGLETYARELQGKAFLSESSRDRARPQCEVGSRQPWCHGNPRGQVESTASALGRADLPRRQRLGDEDVPPLIAGAG